MPRRAKRVPVIPLEQRANVRAVILARMSDPNARDDSMESQVEACERFIAKMGWPKPTLGPFTDKRSGYLDVERPALDEVERLIAQRAVDVVVVLNFERLARKLERRYAALHWARRYGVEYRFAELAPDGKMADDLVSKIVAPVLEVYGEINRQKIVENTARGRAKRVAMGYPNGGRGGPPYGLRKATLDDATRYWAERPDEADVLRLMFNWIVEKHEADDPALSGRRLTEWLNTHGYTTREGKRWTTTTVMEKLRNPLYCGRGRLNRWQVNHKEKADEHTHEAYQVREVQLRDAAETFPIADGMMPTLIDPDLFDRVQAILDASKRSAGRRGRVKSTKPDDATLLHSGYIRCAKCKRAMVRYWRPASPKYPDGVAYYRCSTNATDPNGICTRHALPAATADDYALRALAQVMSDPEKVLALADAAEQRLEHADYVVTRTTTDIEAMETLVATTEAQIADTYRAIEALSKLPNQADTVARLRADLLDLHAQRDRAALEHNRLQPRRNRAQQRADFLRAMFTAQGHVINVLTGETTPRVEPHLRLGLAAMRLNAHGEVERYRTLSVAEASSLLGTDVRDTTIEPLAIRADPTYPTDDIQERYALSDVIYSLLRRTPHAQRRKLLRELDVAVWVSPPRPPAERATHGITPAAERVSVQVGNLLIRGRALTVAGDSARSADAANGTTFLENTSAWRRKLREAEYGSLERDHDFLAEISPIHKVDRISAPLFVVHGANDPRVPVGEAEQIVASLRSRGRPVEYLRYEDEGHGLIKRANRLIAYLAIARFLDHHIGDGASQ